MLKYFYKLMRKKGFTLVELVVVIAIIGILSAILIPTFMSYYTDAKIKTANSTAHQIKNIISLFMAEMAIQHTGMKQIQGVNAQMIFMVKGGKWLVKTECKVKGKTVDTDGSLTFFDHTNWWKNNAVGLMKDTTTRNDPNHQLALCRAVADSCEGLDTGFIMAFFTAGVCSGVVYIPDCDYVWPDTKYIDPDAKALASGRPEKRPVLVRSQNYETKKYGLPALKEFSPWNGVWPTSADDNIWNGVAGVDTDGFIVGTAPEIGYKYR